MIAFRKTVILTTFLTLVFFNLSRVIGFNFFAHTKVWSRIISDDLHHYQIGIILLILLLLLRNKLGRLKYPLTGMGAGTIIDESKYLFYPSYWKFDLYSLPNVILEFTVFIIFALIVYWLPFPTLPIAARR